MAESIRQPDELVLAGNIAENWRKFKQEFELYLVATGLDTKTSKQKIALLLHVARKKSIEVYNTFSFTEEEDGDFDSVIEKLNSYLIRRRIKRMSDTCFTVGNSYKESRLNNS